MNRRKSDHFPITDRMTCPVLRWVDAARRNPWIVAGPCVMAVVYSGWAILFFAGGGK